VAGKAAWPNRPAGDRSTGSHRSGTPRHDHALDGSSGAHGNRCGGCDIAHDARTRSDVNRGLARKCFISVDEGIGSNGDCRSSFEITNKS